MPLLALLKHPFARRGQDGAAFRARARELDRWCLRGPRPDPGLAGIADAIAKAGATRAMPPPPKRLAALAAWWDEIAAILAPLEDVFAQNRAAAGRSARRASRRGGSLACDERSDCLLWRDADGEAAALFCRQFRDGAAGLPAIEPRCLSAAVAQPGDEGAGACRASAAIRASPFWVRWKRGCSVSISPSWAGLNEGTWPQRAPAPIPGSRGRCATRLGLEQPERGIGLSAHDFAMLAAGPSVLLTRALKADGAPTIASRWLQRLMQLTRGLGLEDALAPTRLCRPGARA